MTADVLAPPTQATSDGVLCWTVDQFFRLGELGVLDGPGRYELSDGLIYFMPPQSAPHYSTIQQIAVHLRTLLQSVQTEAYVREQGPLVFGIDAYVEPDLAVVAGSRADYKQSHPATALLAVEVSHTPYRKDSSVKRAAYASAQVSEYWIVNLPERRVEVYRDPRGDDYDTRFTFTGERAFAPLFAPGASLTASDLLP